jgi:hypothetical protein
MHKNLDFTNDEGQGFCSIYLTSRISPGPKRDEVTGGWRKLHNEKLHNLYSSPSIIRMVKEDEMGRACSMNGGEEDA